MQRTGMIAQKQSEKQRRQNLAEEEHDGDGDDAGGVGESLRWRSWRGRSRLAEALVYIRQVAWAVMSARSVR